MPHGNDVYLFGYAMFELRQHVKGWSYPSNHWHQLTAPLQLSMMHSQKYDHGIHDPAFYFPGQNVSLYPNVRRAHDLKRLPWGKESPTSTPCTCCSTFTHLFVLSPAIGIILKRSRRQYQHAFFVPRAFVWNTLIYKVLCMK
ncbi:predicted protein [Lichtheimia corymbifera JMRC:FSU:9682]|uniref:Uncharacterized protein n=1 Tax=Lichtheimia corymbifera JMRC:FSU:9682 TaxID=1263082 RepID=A0A068RT50_9FUNG|nr:predicted protein [Lichtheimia corymbifera JMRC:FSU:9682]